MRYSEVEEAVYNWIAANVATTTIYADENGVKPNSDFLMFKIMSFNLIGQRDYTAPDETTGERTVRVNEDFNVSITGFGRSTLDELQRLKQSLQLEAGIEILDRNCIVVRDENVVTDISVEVDDKIEKRYLYELVMGFSHGFVEQSGVIEDFTITSDINQPS